jgi:IS30 family transposase
VGDWEGDTIESAGKNAYIAMFVDRKTKALLAKVMPDKMAAALNKVAIRAFKPIPAQMLEHPDAGHLYRPSLSLMGMGTQRTHQRADTAVPA